MKIKNTLTIFIAAATASYATVFLPPSNGITIGIFSDRQTNTTEFVREVFASGFPITFYFPGGYDYGSHFMSEAFWVNTTIIFSVFIFAYIIYRKETKIVHEGVLE